MARTTLIRFVDLNAQHNEIREDLDTAIARVLDSGQFVLGPEVEGFERDFAATCGVSHAVGTNSGTSALHLALIAAGVGPGDEVITVSLTFWATVAAILYTGATPILVDVDPKSCNIDPAAFERAITTRTRAVVPVHLYGRCADMDTLVAIAHQRGIVVIEDAAQAAGSTYRGRPAGSLGDIACFSFYPAKNLGAIGEGGIVVTDNESYAERVRSLRDHGSRQKYSHDALGYNYRLEAIQGAALRVKLKRLAAWNDARNELAAEYRRLIDGIGILAKAQDGQENNHIFPAFTSKRDRLRHHLADQGIETGVHYPIPAHLQPAYALLRLPQVDLPQTERICRQVLSLPMHPHLSNRDVVHVAATIRSFVESVP